MFESCLEKQNAIQVIFEKCVTEEAKYEKIIEFGKQLPKIHPSLKTSQNLVSGCQSETFLHATLTNDKVYFEIGSDALISAGLAAILVKVYNNETPETILKCAPVFLEKIGINTSLTPSRANGLYSIHLRMKQEALKLLMTK